MDTAQAEAALREAAKRYHQADAARQAAMDELRRCMIGADKAGLPRAHIAAIAGVARQTVYDALHGR
jgi:hypothetical protein